MSGVLTGYSIIFIVIAVGYFVARVNLVPQDFQPAINRLVFYVCTPALMFDVLAHSDITVLISNQLTIAVLSFAGAAVLYAIIASFIFRVRRPLPVIFGSMSSAWVNSNNIGLPVAIYMLGSAEWVAPVLLFQLAIMTPVMVTAVASLSSGKFQVKKALLTPITNPLVIGSLLGVVVSATGLQIPEPIYAPFEMIGAAAIPMILMAFGMSLRGSRPLSSGAPKRQIITASVIKVALMPILAWLIARFVFEIEGLELYAAVVVSALPTAQNMYNMAVTYNNSVLLTRDTALVTTVASFPALLVIALFLA